MRRLGVGRRDQRWGVKEICTLYCRCYLPHKGDGISKDITFETEFYGEVYTLESTMFEANKERMPAGEAGKSGI